MTERLLGPISRAKAEQALGHPREYNVRYPHKNSEKIVLNVHLWGKNHKYLDFTGLCWTLLAIKKNDKRGLYCNNSTILGSLNAEGQALSMGV